MAGRGPSPKDPRKRARTNSDSVPVRYVEVRPDKQPALADLLGDVNPATQAPWSEATVAFWESLGEFPSTDNLLRAQWSILARAMVLDDLMMAGDVRHASELRLQLAKFFVAPDDMMRGRIVAAQADEADAKRPASPARDRYADLRVVAPTG
jgi:hypothetical protein